jgi:heptosyltransferase-2
MAEPESNKISRIVVRGTNWVGDAMMTVPALRELRRLFPNAHITLSTRPWAQGLFADADFIDALQVNEGDGLLSVIGQVRDWRNARFDAAVLFPNSFAAALVAFLARVPIRIGYATDRRESLLTHPLAVPEWRASKHEVFYYMQIIAELERHLKGTQTFLETQPDGSLQVSESHKAAARDLLRAKGVDGKRQIIALCPGSINSRAKRWPAESYAALADRLVNDLGAQVLLIGSGYELQVSQEVSRAARHKPILLTGETNLEQLVGVLSQVDLLITNDTGPAHIAAALSRPTLVIFGPTNPLTTRPFSPYGEVIRQPPDCAPCMLRDCPIDHRCMTAITPDDVFAHARAVLGRGEPANEMPGVTQSRASLTEVINKLRFAGQIE